MSEKRLFEKLNKLFREAPTIEIGDTDKIVIFSDLHMGNGSTRDDFLRNSDMFKYILEQHYLKNNYKLVLNGDIEELQRFSLKQIIEKWKDLYRLFEEFAKQKSLYKIVGNHDHDLHFKKGIYPRVPIYKALNMKYRDHQIVLFHGHQASKIMERFHVVWKVMLRYIVNPIGIKNVSHSHVSVTRFKTERRVYNFARENKILSVIGHTHRPLFESLSKIDCLKFKIEQLCREYSTATEGEKQRLARNISLYNRDLQDQLSKKNKREGLRSSLYNSALLVPCIFNSGCVIGKKGITAIEICNGNISLVHWFDKQTSNKYFDYNGFLPQSLEDSNYYRVTLKEDNLNYIFARIELLA